MKGDAADMTARLRLTLPEGWAADRAPLLDAVLRGLGVGWAAMFELLREVKVQSRLATVTGRFLDLACTDFFGGRFGRRSGEVDEALRARFVRELRKDRGTRAALITAASEAGYSATVFEPARPADTGAYGVSTGLAWGVAGGWGSLEMPLECLVTVRAVAPLEEIGGALTTMLPAGGAAWIRVLP